MAKEKRRVEKRGGSDDDHSIARAFMHVDFRSALRPRVVSIGLSLGLTVIILVYLLNLSEGPLASSLNERVKAVLVATLPLWLLTYFVISMITHEK